MCSILLGSSSLTVIRADQPPPVVDDLSALVWITEEYEPYNFTQNGELTGLSVEIARLIWKEIGVAEKPVLLFPWARGYKMLETIPGTVLFATARTPERERLFKWVGPIATNRYALIGRAGETGPAASAGLPPGRRIAAVRRDVAENLVIKAGIAASLLSSVDSIDIAIRMLDQGRVDYVAYGERSFFTTASLLGLDPTRFQARMILSESSLYFAINHSVSDRIVLILQNAMDVVAQKPGFRQLQERYLR
ncbi:MAG: transporter substrate-binding domain-containing protein [Spirochaetes bacterium]|nr:transporter substrate-binding domain-containing protein [Spirochaetota bacterium]